MKSANNWVKTEFFQTSACASCAQTSAHEHDHQSQRSGRLAKSNHACVSSLRRLGATAQARALWATKPAAARRGVRGKSDRRRPRAPQPYRIHSMPACGTQRACRARNSIHDRSTPTVDHRCSRRFGRHRDGCPPVERFDPQFGCIRASGARQGLRPDDYSLPSTSSASNTYLMSYNTCGFFASARTSLMPMSLNCLCATASTTAS